MDSRKNTVWVTGSRGFIGRNVVDALATAEYKLTAITNQETSVQTDSISPFLLDYSSRDSIKRLVGLYGCPSVFIHLGWGHMSSPMSEKHLQGNVDEAETLINTLYESGLDTFVFIGSMNEYGARVGPLSEDMEKSGRLTNYAKGKTHVANFGFKRASFFRRKFVHVRPFYVYGPGQRAGSLINELFRAYTEKTRPQLGPCEHYRDYVHVQDVAEGIVRLLKIETSCTVNIGSGRVIKVKDYVRTFWNILGGDDNELKFGVKSMSKDEPEQPRSYADLSRLFSLTGWKPTRSLEAGIQMTVNKLNDTASDQQHPIA